MMFTIPSAPDCLTLVKFAAAAVLPMVPSRRRSARGSRCRRRFHRSGSWFPGECLQLSRFDRRKFDGKRPVFIERDLRFFAAVDGDRVRSRKRIALSVFQCDGEAELLVLACSVGVLCQR